MKTIILFVSVLISSSVFANIEFKMGTIFKLESYPHITGIKNRLHQGHVCDYEDILCFDVPFFARGLGSCELKVGKGNPLHFSKTIASEIIFEASSYVVFRNVDEFGHETIVGVGCNSMDIKKLMITFNSRVSHVARPSETFKEVVEHLIDKLLEDEKVCSKYKKVYDKKLGLHKLVENI